MRANIHPANYKAITATCRCGAQHHVCLAIDQDQLLLDVCAKCHPAYTKTKQTIATKGKGIENFYRRFQKYKSPTKTTPLADE